MEGPTNSTSYLIVDHQFMLVYAIPAVTASMILTILTAPFDYVKTQIQLKQIKRFSTSSRNTIITTIKSQDIQIVLLNTVVDCVDKLGEIKRLMTRSKPGSFLVEKGSVLMEGLRPSSWKAKGTNLDVKESRASLKQREIRKILLIYSIVINKDQTDWYSRLWEIILIGLTLSMHVLTLIISIVDQVFFGGSGCGLNHLFIIFNLILCLIVTGISLSRPIQEINPRLGIIHPGVVVIYCTQLVTSAIANHDNGESRCNPLKKLQEGAETSMKGIGVN
ncbi:serine incorporator-domain-containing protein [Phakopsora pachyrhizi]|uniref:Serine incorporator-domain-containing protein n=1 Tax=Phakopsora pachyrhizi TaxID=170000 RepID=A0AAV0BFZ9_PHAPC|nr:serine incorporator-domain-containing protein [Phakopsora pachyrhizi]